MSKKIYTIYCFWLLCVSQRNSGNSTSSSIENKKINIFSLQIPWYFVCYVFSLVFFFVYFLYVKFNRQRRCRISFYNGISWGLRVYVIRILKHFMFATNFSAIGFSITTKSQLYSLKMHTDTETSAQFYFDTIQMYFPSSASHLLELRESFTMMQSNKKQHNMFDQGKKLMIPMLTSFWK